jgi:hypothetical protein
MMDDLLEASTGLTTRKMAVMSLLMGLAWKFGQNSEANRCAALADEQIRRLVPNILEKSCPETMPYIQWCERAAEILRDVEQDPRDLMKTREADVFLLANSRTLLIRISLEDILEVLVQTLTPEQMTAQYRVFTQDNSTLGYFI